MSAAGEQLGGGEVAREEGAAVVAPAREGAAYVAASAAGDSTLADDRKVVKVEIWRIVLLALCFGMIFAISFIEAPLKFLAPGITIPLGLGIGRLVFTALNAAVGVLVAVYMVLHIWPRVATVASRLRSVLNLVMVVVLIFETQVVRRFLNARSDEVIAGTASPGQSPWHYVYIACDVTLLVLMAVSIVFCARSVLSRLSAGSKQ